MGDLRIITGKVFIKQALNTGALRIADVARWLIRISPILGVTTVA